MTTADAGDVSATLSRWIGLVRRARLGDPKKKAAALMVASYADNDGSNVKCGVARLAVDCEMGYSTARRYLAWMREVGLIQLVRAGNRKAKRTDEYRLTIQPDTEKALSALTGDEYRDLIDGVKVVNRAGEKDRRLRSPKASADSAPDSDSDDGLSALTPGVSAEATDSGGPGNGLSALTQGERRNGYLRSPMGEPPPPSKRSPPTGGAPPPDPRRPPSAPLRGTDQQNSLTDPLTPAQDQQRNSRPRASARGGVVIDYFTREAM